MPPARLVYDDDCGFCTRAAELLARHGEFELVGFSAVTPDQQARLPPNWRECAHLLTDDAVFSCGEAMEEAYARTDLPGTGAVPLLRRVPGYGPAREAAYRWIGDHRSLFGRLVHR